MNPAASHSWLRLPAVPLLVMSFSLAMPVAASAGPSDDQVTIYRCTDTEGQLTLRDTPCRPDEQQQTTQMRRPRDPRPGSTVVAAPVAAPVAVTEAPPAAAPAPMRTPPTPVYRCTTPDGDQYTSDSPDGNPRWVPMWTLGYPVTGHRPGGYPAPPVRPASRGAHTGRASPPTRNDRPEFVFDSVGRPTPKPSRSQPGVPGRLPIGGVVQGPGIWVRDACTRVPQVEVCDDLRDRRRTLTRRYNSALQSERQQIDNEKRRIDTQLARECRR